MYMSISFVSDRSCMFLSSWTGPVSRCFQEGGRGAHISGVLIFFKRARFLSVKIPRTRYHLFA